MRRGAGEGFIGLAVDINVVGEMMQLRRMRGEPRHRVSPAGLTGEFVLGPDGDIRMRGG